MTAIVAPADAAIGRRPTRKNWLLSLPALLLLAVVCIGPLIGLFWLSFISEGGFSLVHYERIFGSSTYISIFETTLFIAGGVTALALVLGYPLCYFIIKLPERLRPLALALVSLPLLTSILVRTFAWQILLQRRGIINSMLLNLGIIDQPLQLAFNIWGATAGMLHIVLPLFVLPVYVSMTQIDQRLLQAGSSLGASNTRVFWTIFAPLTLPGVVAGMLVVFIYALGFYITPEILGGGRVVTVSMKVAENATMYAEWGAASSLGLVLLALAIVFIGLSGWLGKYLDGRAAR